MQLQAPQDVVYQAQQGEQPESGKIDKFIKYRRRVERIKKQQEENATKLMTDSKTQIQLQLPEPELERKNSEDSQIPAIKQPQVEKKRNGLHWLFSLLFCCKTQKMTAEKNGQAAGSQKDPKILQTSVQKSGEPVDNALKALQKPKKPSTSQKFLLRPLTPGVTKKCLVLDLDETLVHSSFKPVENPDFIIPVEIEDQLHNVYVLKRPYVDEFLMRMGEHYEIVMFTASLSKYADPVVDQLDTCRVVKHRLFRESCFNHRGSYVKDLSQLGRDIRSIIILDNSPASYLFHPNNALPITSWFNDTTDTELLDIIPLLADMAYIDNVIDVLDQNDDDDEEEDDRKDEL